MDQAYTSVMGSGAWWVWVVGLSAMLCAQGCGLLPGQGEDPLEEPPEPQAQMKTPSYAHLPYAKSVERFEPGPGAGFGQSKMPGVVLGPPQGKGERAGSLDVVSLGQGGEIVLGFGDRIIENGPGVDFIVFENPFRFGDAPEDVFVELGEVAVSEDGESWVSFECVVDGPEAGRWPGCAGWRPTLKFDPLAFEALDYGALGGDGFDLDDVGLSQARFVRIRDLSQQEAMSPSAGFDLDGVGVVNFRLGEGE